MRYIVYILNFWFLGLGGSVCAWFGIQIDSCKNKKLVPVPCEKMPRGCSAFYWDFIRVDWSYDVYNAYFPVNEKGYLNTIRKIIWRSSHNDSVDTVIQFSWWWRKTISTKLCPRRTSLKNIVKIKTFFVLSLVIR